MPSTDTRRGPPTHSHGATNSPISEPQLRNLWPKPLRAVLVFGPQSICLSGVERVGPERPAAEGASPAASPCYMQEEDIPPLS